MDALTAQILHRVERLPARKKAVLLELLSAESPLVEEETAAWKEDLLQTSAWTEEDLAERARRLRERTPVFLTHDALREAIDQGRA